MSTKQQYTVRYRRVCLYVSSHVCGSVSTNIIVEWSRINLALQLDTTGIVYIPYFCQGTEMWIMTFHILCVMYFYHFHNLSIMYFNEATILSYTLYSGWWKDEDNDEEEVVTWTIFLFDLLCVDLLCHSCSTFFVTSHMLGWDEEN